MCCSYMWKFQPAKINILRFQLIYIAHVFDMKESVSYRKQWNVLAQGDTMVTVRFSFVIGFRLINVTNMI